MTYTPGPPAPAGPPDQPPYGGQPVPPPTAWGRPDLARPTPASSGYPTDVLYREKASIGRLWGIPIIGWFVRWLVLIPSIIVLCFVAIVAALLLLVTWIPVLINGRFPIWGYNFIGGLLRWGVRLAAYGYFLSGSYPAFSLSDQPDQDVQVPIDEDQRINRFWGIPIVGYVVRAIILIPHFLCLWILGIVVGFLLIFAWIPVLLLGRQADLFYAIVGGWQRWSFRVGAYFWLLNDRYPPFTLSH